ncbi:MAG TPA: DUF2147 domain-containing protein, partial [Flavipsychrobacter sp.]|nr:DUF2147 domain-containing protein [Flavipsychrobacter sp.]
MFRKYVKRALILLAIFFSPNVDASAQADPIERVWTNGAKTGKVQVYKARDGKFYGKIVWLAEPNRDGKPKLDIHNEDTKKRDRPVMGL